MNEIVVAAIVAIIPLAAYALRVWVTTKFDLNQARIDKLREYATFIVPAVEQYAKNEGWDNEDKAAWAVDQLQAFAGNVGLKGLTDEQAQTIIEATVREAKELWGLLDQQAPEGVGDPFPLAAVSDETEAVPDEPLPEGV